LAMVLHKDVTKTHEEPNVHNATTVANPNWRNYFWRKNILIKNIKYLL
jgi:hypothetical protein